MASGAVFAGQADFTLNGVMPITFTRQHNSRNASQQTTSVGDFGWTWSHNIDTRILTYTTNILKLIRPDGTFIFYIDTNGGSLYEADIPKGETSKLIKNADNTIKRIFKDGTSEEFNADWYLAATVDKNGNSTTLTRDTSNKLTKITDPSGREIELHYGTNNKISQITLPDGKIITR